VAKLRKILAKILDGSRNVAFNDFVLLVEGFGFRFSRANGSHNIFIHPNVKELLNLQNVKGQVKSYQVRQFMELVEKYSLSLEEDK
jgi:predicted RNA binding protein YcfA (HicA-like mRNA interferase family)